MALITTRDLALATDSWVNLDQYQRTTASHHAFLTILNAYSSSRTVKDHLADSTENPF